MAGPDEVRDHVLAGPPPLYERPVPLSSEEHGGLRLSKDRTYGFAADASLVPLNAAEFPVASRYYPIVFGASGYIALAVLGAAGSNEYIDDEGRWRALTYVPAYIRRYPFLFMSAPDDRYILSIDEAYVGFGDAGDGLFEGGQPSELTKNALSFCQVFQREFDATALLIQALEHAGILASELPSFARPGGRKLTVKGVRAIDRDALDRLPDVTFVEWRHKGWLPAIYAHLTSMSNWELVGAQSTKV